MKTEYLQYFLCASESESISKAAERLHLSQQGLSRVIGILEREYGVPLFSRAGTKSALTPAGRQLRTYAKAVLDEYERLDRHMRFLRDPGKEEKFHLALYMTLNAMHNIYPRMASAVHAAFPHCAISTIEIDQREVAPRIRDNKNSNALFFVSAPLPILVEYAADDLFEFRPLIDTELDVLVARNSSLAKRTSFSWKDLEAVDFVMRRDNGMIELLKKRHFRGYPEKAGLWTSDTKAIEATLEGSDTATFSTRFLAKYPETDRFVHIPLNNTYKTPVGFMDKKGSRLSPQAEELRTFVESYVAQAFPLALFAEGARVAKRWVPVRARPA